MTIGHRRLLPALILFLALLLPSPSLADQYQVCRVIDGDTFVVKHGSTKITIGLIGIDAPALSNKKRKDGQPFSRQSTRHLAALILNKTVDVKSYGPDRYGRTLGEVFLLNGMNVNIEMIQAGLAEVYRGKPASGLDMGPYWKAEQEAKAAKRGIWVLGDKYVSPRDWRLNLSFNHKDESFQSWLFHLQHGKAYWVQPFSRLFRSL
jgi:micrococcal nuclease